jgi:hypothetical protein
VTEQGTIAVATVRTFAVHQNWRRVRLVACGLAVLAATTATAAIAASGATTQPELVAFARALIVGLPMAVGLYAWSRSPTQRFGMLLVATSAAWSFTTLAESGDDLSYTLGRSAGWVVEVLVVYLILGWRWRRGSSFRARLRAAGSTARRTPSCCSTPSRHSWRQ